MWWSERLLTLALAAALLAACGFEPVHRPGGALQQQLHNVYVTPVKSTTGQAVRDALLDGLGAPDRNSSATYLLNMQVSELRESLGIQADETVSRVNVNITANWTLLRNDAEQTMIGQGTVTRSAPFNVADDDFSTLAAGRDAQRLVGQLVGDAIRRRVALLLRE